MKKNKNGITLIALVITIIVLLILAGISISLVTGQNGVLTRAQDANSTYNVSSAKEQANMRAAGYVSEYMQKVYVDNDSTVGAMTTGEYVLSQINGKEDGDYSYSVSESTITVTNKTTGQVLASGTVDDNGGITWSDAVSNSNTSTPTLSEDSVASLAKAGEIQRWDRINYNPGTGTTAGLILPEGTRIDGEKLASLTLPAGTSLDGTIRASDASDWVILDVNQTTGEVLIMPRTIPNVGVSFDEIDGFNNAIRALDAVAGIYLNTTYATSARSIRVEDINKIDGHVVPNAPIETHTWNSQYGIDSQTLEITDAGAENTTKNQTYTNTSETVWEEMYLAPSFGGMKDFWIASRVINYCDDVRGRFFECTIRYVYRSNVMSDFRFCSDWGCSVDLDSGFAGWTSNGSPSFGVVPIVILKSDVELESSSKFYTTTATATTTLATPNSYSFEHNTWSFK